MQSGGRYRHERFGDLPDELADSVNFGNYATGLEYPASNNSYTATPNTGYADGDMYLGAASGYTVSHTAPYVHFHDMEFDAYLQDNYHVSPETSPRILACAGRLILLHVGKNGHDDQASLTSRTMPVVLTGTTTDLMFPKATRPKRPLPTILQTTALHLRRLSRPGFRSALLDNYDLTFSPRVGLAYTPFSGKYGTVVRVRTADISIRSRPATVS